MKKVLSILFLPSTLFFCSAASSNAPNVSIAGISIKEESDHIFLVGILKANKRESGYIAYVHYYYEPEGQNKVECGNELFWNANAGYNACSPSNPIAKKALIGRTKLTMEVVRGSETTLYDSITYSVGVNNEIIYFKENSNEQIIAGSYLKESHNPLDPKQDYFYQDQITFLNFEDLHISDFYYDYDISNIKFTYQNGGNNILKATSRLAILDRYNNFPNFPIGNNMYRYLDLSISRCDNYYYFTFKDDLYYDPTTHIASLVKKDNYIKTDHLIFPKNKESELNNLSCYLELNIEGYTKFKLIGYFNISYFKRYMGDCSNSEYCYETYSDNSANPKEEIEEIYL